MPKFTTFYPLVSSRGVNHVHAVPNSTALMLRDPKTDSSLYVFEAVIPNGSKKTTVMHTLLSDGRIQVEVCNAPKDAELIFRNTSLCSAEHMSRTTFAIYEGSDLRPVNEASFVEAMQTVDVKGDARNKNQAFVLHKLQVPVAAQSGPMRTVTVKEDDTKETKQNLVFTLVVTPVAGGGEWGSRFKTATLVPACMFTVQYPAEIAIPRVMNAAWQPRYIPDYDNPVAPGFSDARYYDNLVAPGFSDARFSDDPPRRMSPGRMRPAVMPHGWRDVPAGRMERFPAIGRERESENPLYPTVHFPTLLPEGEYRSTILPASLTAQVQQIASRSADSLSPDHVNTTRQEHGLPISQTEADSNMESDQGSVHRKGRSLQVKRKKGSRDPSPQDRVHAKSLVSTSQSEAQVEAALESHVATLSHGEVRESHAGQDQADLIPDLDNSFTFTIGISLSNRLINVLNFQDQQAMAKQMLDVLDGTTTMKDANESYKNDLCVVCLEKRAPARLRMAFLPCKHDAICGQCLLLLMENKMCLCPLCRAPIFGVSRLEIV